jgi:O-6-methylguanine DNA methyltransferase
MTFPLGTAAITFRNRASVDKACPIREWPLRLDARPGHNLRGGEVSAAVYFRYLRFEPRLVDAGSDDIPDGSAIGTLGPVICRVQVNPRRCIGRFMASFLTEFEFAPKGGIASLSRRYPDVTWDVRPFGFRWMLRCGGPAASLSRLRDLVKADSSFVWVGRNSDSAAAFAYAPRVPEASLLRQIAEKGGFVLPPITMKDGMLRVRFITDRRPISSTGAGGGAIGRLVSLRRLTAQRLEQELERQTTASPTLTVRQAEVLLEAVRVGYYEVPRRSTVKDIARHLLLGRSTAEEHLRIAESTIVRSAAPLVALSREAPVDGQESEPVEHFVRFSSELQLYVDLALRAGRVTGVRFLRAVPPSVEERGHPYLTRILAHIRTGKTELGDIPVELEVGPFENEVLEEIRRIPSGKTRTYAEIARRIGNPRAVRAVGNACAHNPAIVVIPCHRVVPSHGGIGQYSGEGGPETKRRLLQKEGAVGELQPPVARLLDGTPTASVPPPLPRQPATSRLRKVRRSLSGR